MKRILTPNPKTSRASHSSRPRDRMKTIIKMFLEIILASILDRLIGRRRMFYYSTLRALLAAPKLSLLIALWDRSALGHVSALTPPSGGCSTFKFLFSKGRLLGSKDWRWKWFLSQSKDGDAFLLPELTVFPKGREAHVLSSELRIILPVYYVHLCWM